MKEYKVVKRKLAFTGYTETLEDTLNKYAKQGWQFVQFADSSQTLVFERDKNR